MKPTQQDIVDLAREAGVIACGHSTDPEEIAAAERLVHLALERYGAGGGEPVARLMTWIGMDGYPKKGSTVARTYRECPKDAYPHRWEEGPELYTHPSPTDLRAEYLRGLDDAAKVCKQERIVKGGEVFAEKIEALKVKQ